MPKTCMVAEADAFIAELLCRYAEQNGYRAVRASTGPELLHRVPHLRPDLLILDVELPGKVRGWQALAALREERATCGMAVMSCSWLSEADARALAGDVVGHLQKPEVRYADFVAALSRAPAATPGTGGAPPGGSSMNHRERVAAALNRRRPDRCPMQISFTPEFADRLRADMAMSEKVLNLTRSGHNPHGGGNTYELERALGEDMLLTSVGWANSYYQAGDTYTDEWGITWKSHPYETPFGTGHYTEMVRHPLAETRAIDHYLPPDPARPELYEDAARLMAHFGGEYWIVGVTVTTIFETAWALRGYEQMLTDFVTDTGLAERILEIPFRYHLTAAERMVRMGVDMIWIGDDVGMQTGMLISPRLWRRFLKPKMAAFIDALKLINPALKVAYHSDGNILPIIPDLIEVGLDVLNPIQPMCMDPAELGRQYGDKLCFWGTIDEQETLPFGTPASVRDEVLSRLQTIGRDGGLIIGPTHHVQLDTPLDNFWAMVNTITDTPYPA